MIRILTLALFASVPLFAATEATVHWDDQRQVIHGFGACDAWFSDDILAHPARERMLDLAFSRESGAGLSILRHRVPTKASQRIDFLVDVDSSDLDFGKRPLNGIRFTQLAIPPKAEITSAHVQFTAKGDGDSASTLTIRAQASDDAAAFTTTPADLTDRATTDAAVEWTVPAWSADQRGEAQRTPDLTPLLQEVVARPGWASGNALVILVGDYSGPRSAHSIDGEADTAPTLHVTLADRTTISRSVAASADDAEELGRSELHSIYEMTREAFERDCEITWAAAWSPPYEWKRDHDPEDPQRNGFLMREHYQDFADYLEAYHRDFEAATGIELYGISPQNEPGKKPWESCEWNPEDFRDFIRDFLHPTLDESCRIIAPEVTRWHELHGFYKPTHQDEAAHAAVDILAFHCYGGVTDHSFTHYGKPVWETEFSYNLSEEDLGIGNGVLWAHNWWRMLVNADVSAVHHWWLVNFKHRQQGLINANRENAEIEVPKRLWTTGNFSKFVRPGWHRIGATDLPLGEGEGGGKNERHGPVELAAFKHAESGEFAIVLINRDEAEHELTVAFDGFACETVTPHRTSAEEDLVALEAIPAGAAFTANLPATSVTTYVGTALE